MMTIRDTKFTTLEEIKDFFSDLAPYIFTSVKYDNDESPTAVVLMDGDNEFVKITMPDSNVTIAVHNQYGNIYTMVYYASDSSFFAVKSHGGVFMAQMLPTNNGYTAQNVNSSESKFIAFSKTSSDHPAAICFHRAANDSIASFMNTASVPRWIDTVYAVTYDDSNSSPLYYSANTNSITQFFMYYWDTGTVDRTILQKLPVVGTYGSTDYVSDCMWMEKRQSNTIGYQTLDGKRYVCCSLLAFLDEDE